MKIKKPDIEQATKRGERFVVDLYR